MKVLDVFDLSINKQSLKELGFSEEEYKNIIDAISKVVKLELCNYSEIKIVNEKELLNVLNNRTKLTKGIKCINCKYLKFNIQGLPLCKNDKNKGVIETIFKDKEIIHSFGCINFETKGK